MTDPDLSPPAARPGNPLFSSGPCSKRPGWTPEALAGAFLGRSHRSSAGKAKLAEVIARSRSLLGIPEDYRLGIVPASDTGAVELALWSLLGARGVDVLAWESFGSGWASDVVKQLKLSDVRVLDADYGRLPDLSQVDPGRDTVFTWNGTTSGVRVPDGDWIADARDGGEAAHGMLALSPRAVARLESYRPPWPLPKIFRLTKDGKLIEGIFRGVTINTPSMLCVEDALDSLAWAEGRGGLPALVRHAEDNLALVSQWVDESDWADFLAIDPSTRSCTSICLRIVDPWFDALGPEGQAAAVTALVDLLEAEGVGYDLGAYRDAPPGLRLWGGATVGRDDLAALLPWLDWAYATVRRERHAA